MWPQLSLPPRVALRAPGRDQPHPHPHRPSLAQPGEAALWLFRSAQPRRRAYSEWGVEEQGGCGVGVPAPCSEQPFSSSRPELAQEPEASTSSSGRAAEETCKQIWSNMWVLKTGSLSWAWCGDGHVAPPGGV